MNSSKQKFVFVKHASFGNQAEIQEVAAELLAKLPRFNNLTPASRVLIKPNLLAKHDPNVAATTHPDVLRAVILALQAKGVQDITVADSPGGVYNRVVLNSIYKVCGMEDVCVETGVSLYTACESAPLQANGKQVKAFNVIQPVHTCDIIINLPKLKSHVMTMMSAATKNLFGCVPGLQKAEFHMQYPEKPRFGQMIVDLKEALPPTIHLVDAILAMEGDGPSGGQPRRVELLFAGENAYTLDLCLCRYMGLDPMQVPYLAAAHQNGLCPARFDEQLLASETTQEKQSIQGFVLARSYTGKLNFAHSLPSFLSPFVPAVERWIAPKPAIRTAVCIGCGKCAEICPQKVITISKKKAHIAYKTCIHCFCCHEMCPVKAIDVRRNRFFGM